MLEALLNLACGDRAAALASLRNAIRAGEPGDVLRIFVDAGPELIPLLHELAGQGFAVAYIGRIIAATASTDRAPTVPTPEGPSSPPVAGTFPSPEALTNRELDVLVLLERRLSNKEIATLLYISPLTVKRHTISLYQKLHVDNRRAAVAQARALGLLPSA